VYHITAVNVGYSTLRKRLNRKFVLIRVKYSKAWPPTVVTEPHFNEKLNIQRRKKLVIIKLSYLFLCTASTSIKMIF
jgi:hypothetical protein